ncbi:MAG: alpha-mannosidase [Clostridia bacterium]|nr:alpha-mannosidase [Clostridia bacterium]
MNNPTYIGRTYRKFESALNLYADRIVKTVGHAEGVLGFETMDHLRLPPAAADMTPVENGKVWGCEYGNLWLRATVTVPECADGQILCAIPDADAVEILCYRNNVPAGIINSKNNFIGGMHPCFFVSYDAKAGETYDLAFECYAGHTCFGTQPYEQYGRDESKSDTFTHTYRGIRIAVMDPLMRDFVFDLATVLQMAKLPGENFVAMKAHECLMNAFPYLIGDPLSADEDEIRESIEAIRRCLAPALEKTGGEASRGKIGVIGHSHMDTAWLWPVSETIRKCARTYAEALNLMDFYPEYTFIQSSALHLDWMREYYPDIFEGIRARVAEGRYEPNGGVWVECDCNITGGEAMVRQFLYGQRFTEKYLNYRSDSFWLPDTFGYNGAIPQIMQGCGVKYFYTTKMSWNDCNQFPADTFVWRGIDGTAVITHLNRMHLIPDVSTLTGCVGEIRDKKSNNQRLVAYGYGDGGGGPTYGMLEFLKRAKDLPGMPEIKPTTASAFMHSLEERRDKLPTYDGELYLEFHRGTLTQMHMVKKFNRKTEIALYEMELANVLAGKPTAADHDALYKILLKNQFHDILPGTCIPKVYEVYEEEMTEANRAIAQNTDGFLAALSEDAPDTVSVFNPLAFETEAAVEMKGEHAFENKVTQTYVNPQGEAVTVFRELLPALSSVTLKKAPKSEAASRFTREGNVLTTPYYTVTFDENGYIASLVDRQAEREIANTSGAPLGTLWIGEDMPTAYDNWEIEDDVFKKMKAVSAYSVEVVSDGAVEYRIRARYSLGRKSSAILDTVFWAGSRQIDYELTVDWHERHQLLKAGFDVAIRSAFMKNEIQFGHVDRPTTRNTTLESAKFEVCNHKWTDLSETNYGVAILNDCKYGISCEQSDIRLTLHKGGCRPDPFTDNGIHTMKYALLPHVGPFNALSVVRPAYAFNYAPVVLEGKVLTVPALFSVDRPNILAEAVKNAEDREGAFVIRLYEAERSATKCTLSVPGAKRVFLTNMLEEEIEELPVENGCVKLSFRPFEIKTILAER